MIVVRIDSHDPLEGEPKDDVGLISPEADPGDDKVLISGDPLEGESTLLGGDTGDLAEMAAEADQGELEVEFDDSLADIELGDDV